ncbi:MAG: PIN domain-containing protein, partial [Ruminococcus sp.]|nr:PIN domain-containing protein [Ruminococcus sp.]
MNIFLVDYENVNVNGFQGVEELTPNDKIILFYSINSESIKIDIINTIKSKKVSLKFFKLQESSKNALDFQLVLY